MLKNFNVQFHTYLCRRAIMAWVDEVRVLKSGMM